MQKLKVSIGIPAYNEEANIKKLLLSILEQRHESFDLQKIHVLSDGSSDATVAEVQSVQSALVEVIDSKDRKGKVARVNELIEHAKESDVFIQFDADITLKGTSVLEELIRPFIENPETDLVCGDHESLPPRTFVEKLATFGERGWEQAKAYLGEEAGAYRCLGQIRAFSKRMLQDFRVPVSAENMEDVYSFFYAKQHNLKVVYAPNARVYFRLVSSSQDYIKQLSRTIRVHTSMHDFYDSTLVAQYETMTPQIKVRALVHTALRTLPHITLSYLVLHTYTRIVAKLQAPKQFYDTAHSSKKL